MKRKNKRGTWYVGGMLITLSLLSGCGAQKSQSMDALQENSMEYSETDSYYDSVITDEEAYDEGEIQEESGVDSSAANTSVNLETTNRKLIKNVSIDLETKEFDRLMEDLSRQIEQLNGYIENSDIRGNSYYDFGGDRYASMQVRIPAEQLEGFLQTVGKLGNIIGRQESVEDVTLQYVDVESHKKALAVEQERLLALLEKAELLEDIITLETRLSEVRYKIESYEAKLRTFDNLVTYSTVSISIREVERETPIAAEKTTWERIQSGFSDNVYRIFRSLKAIMIWFLISIPYLVIWGIMILICLIVIKLIMNRKKKKEKQKEKMLHMEQESNEKNVK